MSAEPNKTAAPVPGAGAASGAKKKSSLPRWIILVLLAVAVAGGSAWFVFQPGRNPEASHTANTSAAPKYLIHLEGFTVNLADPEETHFLRVTMDLGVDRLPEGADKEKAAATLPAGRIRDSILTVLTACKADALLTSEGKVQLKKSLVEALSRDVPELGVRDVYFTEFLVQR
jgi:flagellar protein FliL